MKIAAILLANASAVLMGDSSAPKDVSPADVKAQHQITIPIVLDIDKILDAANIDAGSDDESSHSEDESWHSDDESSHSEDESDGEDAEPGFCRNIVHQQYHWLNSSTGEVVKDGHEECFDGCLAAGGKVKKVTRAKPGT